MIKVLIKVVMYLISIERNEITKEETIRELEVLVNEWDDALRVLKIVIKAHEKGSKHWKYFWEGFTYHDCLRCGPWDLSRLAKHGILVCVSPDGKRNTYQVVNLDTVVKFITAFKEGLIKNEATDEPKVRLDPLLLNSFFDDIIGYDDLKDLIIKALKKEKASHFIFIGPPSSAKSMFLDEIMKLPKSAFAVGTTSSKVGILDILFDERPDYLVIDEIDKANPKDIAVLNTLMWRGMVSETKHRKTRELRLNTFVFMAANSDKTIYRDILSRAHVFYFGEYDNETYIKTVVGVLSKEGIDQSIAESVAKHCLGDLRTRDVREAIRIGRLADNIEEVETIIQTLKKYKRRRR